MADVKNITTGEARLSYIHAFKPYAHKPGDTPKYSVTILVPKNDYTTKQRIDAAIAAATADGIASKWSGVRPPLLPTPVHDGDLPRPSDGMPYGEECRGHWVFTASNVDPIKVVDLSVQPILNQSDVYSGMYGRVAVKFYAYNSNGKKGIGCGLSNIQKTRDGEALGSRTSAEEDFADSAQYAQQVGTPPVQGGYASPQAQPINQSYQPPQYSVPVNQGQVPVYAQPQLDPITGMPIR